VCFDIFGESNAENFVVVDPENLHARLYSA
jgi:hypothetical protein